MFSITLFQQVLKAIPRGLVHRLSAEHQSSKYDKSFDTYSHLVALIYAQISGAKSLRLLQNGFNAQSAHHYHLGVKPLHRSTLADANHRRKPAVFKEIAEYLMATVHRKLRRDLQELIYLIDASPIHLSGPGYEWTEATATCRHQGLKLHLQMEAQTLAPTFIQITPPNVNDITPAWDIEPEAGATYVFDKGYTGHAFWYRWEEAEARFVSRFKRNARLKVEESRPVSDAAAGFILADEIVTMSHRSNRGRHTNPYYGTPLRRITVAVEGRKPLILSTNDLHSPPEEIADLYRQRWGIELFFKWIKQHLNLRHFLGKSPNAVLLQIYAAIITYLLVWLHKQQQVGETLSHHLYLAVLQSTLFNRIETEQQRHYRQQRRERAAFLQENQHVMAF